MTFQRGYSEQDKKQGSTQKREIEKEVWKIPSPQVIFFYNEKQHSLWLLLMRPGSPSLIM